MTKQQKSAALLLALCAVAAVAVAVVAIDSADVPLTGKARHHYRDAEVTGDRVDALRSKAMRDDVDRVSRLDTDHISGHTIVRDRDLPLRRSHSPHSPHGKALHIRRFNAEKQKFDLRRAEGVWYQHAVNRDFYNRYEKGCSCPVALVRPKSDTESLVQYACVNKTGDLTVVRGVKRMESPGKFAMTPQEKRIGEKIVKSRDDKTLMETVHDEILALDDNMQWKIMYNAKNKGVFIYSRKPTLDSRLINDMLSFIEKHTGGEISIKDMKLFKHEQTCEKLQPLMREFSGRYHGKGKSDESDDRRKHSPHRHFIHESSGAEPRREDQTRAKANDKADEKPPKLDLSLMKGQWFEIARSRVTSETTERGCACGLALFDVSENAFNAQYACLNTTAKDDESKIATASARAVMDPNQEGMFRSKMLSKRPGKLSEEEGKERKLILLALGDNFAATLEPDRKSVHILSRNTTMEKDLVGALSEMLQSIGVNPKELDRVDQAATTCSAFHEKAKSKFGAAKAKGAEHGLETKKGLQQTGAADTRDEKLSGSDEKRDDKRSDKKESSQSQTLHGFTDFDGVEQGQRFVTLIPQGEQVINQPLKAGEPQPLMAEQKRVVYLIPQGEENQPAINQPLMAGAPQPLMGDEAQALGGIETAAPSQQQGAAAAPAGADDATPPPLDATILGGNWFDIAVSMDAYNLYHRGCECTQQYIQALDSNKLHIVGGCMNKTDNQLVTCVAGGVQDPASPGLFRLQELDKQPYGLLAAEKAIHEKVVLAVGKDFAVIAEPAINSAWILSRSPTMAADLYDRLIALLGKIGFPKDSFRKYNHELPECQAVTTQMQAIGKQAAQQPAKPAAAPAAPAAAPATPATPPAAPAAAPAAAPPAVPSLPIAPAAPTAPAAPALPATPAPAPAASAASPLPRRPRVFGGEQPLAGDQQQYIADNPAYYGGDSYATEQPLAADEQSFYAGDEA